MFLEPRFFSLAKKMLTLASYPEHMQAPTVNNDTPLQRKNISESNDICRHTIDVVSHEKSVKV